MLLYHQRGVTLMARKIDRKDAHDLIDQRTPEQIRAAIPVLGSAEPLPIEDEEISEAEKAAVAEADEWLKLNGGRGIPMEEVLADFGLTMDDFPAACNPDRNGAR
jgi:hypothetical protein